MSRVASPVRPLTRLRRTVLAVVVLAAGLVAATGLAAPAQAETVHIGSVDAGAGHWAGYSVTLSSGQSTFLHLGWVGNADLNLFLKDPSGTVVARSTGSSGPESIAYTATQPGEHRISIIARSGAATYSLAVVDSPVSLTTSHSAWVSSTGGAKSFPVAIDAYGPHVVEVTTDKAVTLAVRIRNPKGAEIVTASLPGPGQASAEFTAGWISTWSVEVSAIAGSGAFTVEVRPRTEEGTGSTNWTPPPTPPPPPPPAPAGTDAVRLWAARNEGSYHNATLDEALDVAARYDVISAHWFTYFKWVDEMKAVNPDLVLVAYMNAAFLDPKDDPRPDGWYLRDSAGNKIRSSGYGNYLMDVSNPAWHEDRADECHRLLFKSSYDGCMLDMVTIAPLFDGYTTAKPTDPRTNKTWTKDAWQADVAAIAAHVRQENAPAVVIGNGWGSGNRYFSNVAPSSMLNDDLDGAIAESWFRAAAEPAAAPVDPDKWTRAVELLEDAGAAGVDAYVMVKAWGSGSEAAKEALHRFALATFLLGTDGSARFHFSYGSNTSPIDDHALDAVRIGLPLGDRTISGGVHRRAFTGGLVVVNPDDQTRSTTVPGGLVDDEGNPVSTALTLGPRSAVILSPA